MQLLCSYVLVRDIFGLTYYLHLMMTIMSTSRNNASVSFRLTDDASPRKRQRASSHYFFLKSAPLVALASQSSLSERG